MAKITSGSGAVLENNLDSNHADTAYSYRTAEDYGADYGVFGRLGNWIGGYNDAAESAAANYNAEMTNKYNSDEAQKARDFNATEAQKERDWSEYMSSTSYQRAVADAKKAGINPYYVLGSGGASSGSSSSASSSAASSGGSPSYSRKQKSGKGGTVAATALAIAKVAAILAAA